MTAALGDPATEYLARQLACQLQEQHGPLDQAFALTVAHVLLQLQRETGVPWVVISGYRSPEKQEELITRGRGAPQDLSNHTSCPAFAVDVWPRGLVPVTSVRWALGRIATMHGLRWGGCDAGVPGCIDENTGIPQDWNHLDTGRRALREGRV